MLSPSARRKHSASLTPPVMLSISSILKIVLSPPVTMIEVRNVCKTESK